MTDTSYDEARRCYRCKELGKQVSDRPASERYMGRIHTYRCMNARCIGFERDWIIQVRPDGSIPPPIMNREKSFPVYDTGVSNQQKIAKARAQTDALVQQSLEK